MKAKIVVVALLLTLLAAKPASAAHTQLLVESNLSAPGMNLVCLLEGCHVTQSVQGSPNNFFLLSVSNSWNTQFLVNTLQRITGILDVTIIGGEQNPLGVRYIVHTTGGLVNLPRLCSIGLCQVIQPLDGGLNQVFLLAGPSNEDPTLFLNILRAVPGIIGAEVDQVVSLATGSATVSTPPPGLVDATPVQYYGSTVWEGYVNQPAAQVINLAQTQTQFGISGSGIIADIDTGVDPNHPVLQPVLLPGYDFTRNQSGGSEMNDLPNGAPTTETPCVNCTPGQVNQYSIAMVDQYSIAMVDSPQYADFGHGTMVAGLLHLVAPTASIMPLKAFGPDGTGNLSDIVRAVYYAAQNNANVVNMSFDLTTPSKELQNAVTSAEQSGIVFVASAGNDGRMETTYPAGYSNVIGVASTNEQDQRSTFSNYGDQIVWVAAPGEAIVSTYPFGAYAAGWGTSFSAPLVSGGVSLLRSLQPNLAQLQAQFFVAQAQLLLDFGMGNGRLDLQRASSAANLGQGGF